MSLSKKIEMWPVDKVKPYPKNAKKHKVKWIAKSIGEFDFDQPIVVDKDGVIIKGHGRLEAAKHLEMKEVPVIVRRDLTKKQAAMARIADNRVAQGGGMDIDLLSEEIDFLKDDFDSNFFDDLGFTDGFLKKMAKEDLFDFINEEDDSDNEDTEETYIIDKFPLSIVLNQEQYEKWEKYKNKIKKTTDTAAFIKLMESIK